MNNILTALLLIVAFAIFSINLEKKKVEKIEPMQPLYFYKAHEVQLDSLEVNIK